MLARLPVWSRNQLVGVQTSRLAANGIGPMPPTIADREVKYPITFVKFDDVMRVLGGYEIAMALPSPSSNYTIQGQLVQGISLLFRLKETR